MTDLLAIVMQASLVVFMCGSLLGMGLALSLGDALAGLADLRFGTLVLVLGFGMGPALAYGLAALLRLDPAYGAGLMLLGLTPCAPFLSMLADRAGGDKTRVASCLLISAVSTILLLPVAVPLTIPGLSVSAWTIARPLLLIVLLPLALGMAVLRWFPDAAARSVPAVRAITGIATIIMLGLCAVLYGKGFTEAVGTRSIAAQALFFGLATLIAYACGTGLRPDRRSVLTLGICTRNVGAALAPVLAASGADQRMVIMVVMGVPMQLIFAFAAARWLAARRT
jgi:BASS family bile acid:Na+ symporter